MAVDGNYQTYNLTLTPNWSGQRVEFLCGEVTHKEKLINQKRRNLFEKGGERLNHQTSEYVLHQLHRLKMSKSTKER